MLRNSLNKLFKKPEDFKIWKGIVLPIWVLAGFILAQVVAGLILLLLKTIGVSFDNINGSVFQTIVAACIYVFAIIIVIGIPWVVRKYRTTTKDLGLNSWMSWADLLLAPAGFVIYLILSLILTSLAMNLPFYDAEQVQDTGFAQLTQNYEYVLAFLTLVVIAPIAEEILFRGYLLGKLRKHIPTWIAILVTSILFGVIHLAWNVGVDVFALSIVLCVLRIKTGRLWPAMLLHMMKNGIAFYFLFINPIV